MDFLSVFINIYSSILSFTLFHTIYSGRPNNRTPIVCRGTGKVVTDPGFPRRGGEGASITKMGQHPII